MSVSYCPPYSLLQRSSSYAPPFNTRVVANRDSSSSLVSCDHDRSSSWSRATAPPPFSRQISSSPVRPCFPGVLPSSASTTSPHLRGQLRRGKWTLAEEQYTAATIQYFCTGALAIPYGTTLRSHLAQQLHCDPMRISKKLLPGSIVAGFKMMPKIGRRGYYPRLTRDADETAAMQQQAGEHLEALRAAFIASLDALREEEDEYELLEAHYRDYYQQRAMSASAVVSMPADDSPGGRKRRLLDTKWAEKHLASTCSVSRRRTHSSPYHHQQQHRVGGGYAYSPVSSDPGEYAALSALSIAAAETAERQRASSTASTSSPLPRSPTGQQLPSLRASLQRASLIMAAKHSR